MLRRLFNKPVITDVKLPADTLAALLNEPLPDGADVLAWYAKNIPANDY